MPKQDEIFLEDDLEYCPLNKLKTMLDKTPINDKTVEEYVELLQIIRNHEKYIRLIRQNFETHLREFNLKNLIEEMDIDS